MIYVDTQREFWAFQRTTSRVLGPAPALGSLALPCCALLGNSQALTYGKG